MLISWNTTTKKSDSLYICVSFLLLPQIKWLKTILIYYFTISVGQKCWHGLARSLFGFCKAETRVQARLHSYLGAQIIKDVLPIFLQLLAELICCGCRILGSFLNQSQQQKEEGELQRGFESPISSPSLKELT